MKRPRPEEDAAAAPAADKEVAFAFSGEPGNRNKQPCVFTILASDLNAYPESPLATAARVREEGEGVTADTSPILIPRHNVTFIPFIMEVYRMTGIHGQYSDDLPLLTSVGKLPRTTPSDELRTFDFSAAELQEELDYYQLPFKLERLVMDSDNALDGDMDRWDFAHQVDAMKFVAYVKQDILAALTVKEMRANLCKIPHAAAGEALFVFTQHPYASEFCREYMGVKVAKPWMLCGSIKDLDRAIRASEASEADRENAAEVLPPPPGEQLAMELELPKALSRANFWSDPSRTYVPLPEIPEGAYVYMGHQEDDSICLDCPDAAAFPMVQADGPSLRPVRAVAGAMAAQKGLVARWYRVRFDEDAKDADGIYPGTISVLLLHLSWA